MPTSPLHAPEFVGSSRPIERTQPLPVVFAMQPVLGPLVDGDLCDIVVGRRAGRSVRCNVESHRVAFDVDGRERLLCAEHAAMYFPAVAL